jgi:phosphoribosylglycinamide formyltransferase 1
MRVAVLASGTGSILDSALAAGVRVAVVVVDRPCAATDVAERYGVPWELVERTSFGRSFDRDAYTLQVLKVLKTHDIGLVAVAGFGTVLAPVLFEEYGGRVINTHPALLPSFRGWHAVEQALEVGVKVTGCTVHVVTAEVDAGPILAQEPVRVLPDDTVESLHERIKIVERQLYVDTIRSILERGSVL